jgi:hypothetical protein
MAAPCCRPDVDLASQDINIRYYRGAQQQAGADRLDAGRSA